MLNGMTRTAPICVEVYRTRPKSAEAIAAPQDLSDNELRPEIRRGPTSKERLEALYAERELRRPQAPRKARNAKQSERERTHRLSGFT